MIQFIFLIITDIIYFALWAINPLNFFSWLYLCISYYYLFKVTLLVVSVGIGGLVYEFSTMDVKKYNSIKK